MNNKRGEKNDLKLNHLLTLYKTKDSPAFDNSVYIQSSNGDLKSCSFSTSENDFFSQLQMLRVKTVIALDVSIPSSSAKNRRRSRSRDRERRHRHRRSRSRSPKRYRSRSPHRRSISPRRRSRSRSLDSKERDERAAASSSADTQVPVKIDEAELEGKTEEEINMMKTMGFCGFDSTKNKQVNKGDTYVANIQRKRRYRQYMNRKGGFNRPLDFIA